MLLLDRYFGADQDGRFPCPLPGHTGTARIDSPDPGVDPELRLLCCGGRWRSLGEVAASVAYGEDRMRSNIEIATWLRRLVHEAGSFALADVELPPLPSTASAPAHIARAGVALLFGVRWADGPHREVALSIRFLSAWSRLTFREARCAIAELDRFGVIAHSGQAGRTRLYLPGRHLRAIEGDA